MTGPQNPGEYPGYGAPPAQPGPPQYGQPQYGQPHYEQPRYQHPYGHHPAHVYPQQPPGASVPRVSVQWSGALMLLGGAILAVGSFLDWAKVTLAGRHVSITGLGSLSGDAQYKQFVSPSKVTDGKVTLTFGILLLVGAVIILARQGRVWVGIVGTVLSAICLVIGLADIGQASNVNDTYRAHNTPAHLSVQIGLVLTLVGAVVALAFSIVAICVRRQKV